MAHFTLPSPPPPAPSPRPLIIFNGELDRTRGGYYPSFAFGELAKLSKDFIPDVRAAARY